MAKPSKLNRKYGWRPCRPDPRDHIFAAGPHVMNNLPSKVDLRPLCPTTIYDQGSSSSCTANALACAIEFDLLKQGLPDFMPSRLFIYYNERAMENSTESDNGAAISDGAKAVNQFGVCNEATDWPFDLSKITVKPSEIAYTNAKQHQALSYRRVNQTLSQLKSCLASGFPFVFGITIFESFESDSVAQTGRVPMPSMSEGCQGGHAITCVGFSDDTQSFICRNSWGPSWGDKGYFYLDYQYVTSQDLASDFWTFSLVK